MENAQDRVVCKSDILEKRQTCACFLEEDAETIMSDDLLNVKCC